MRLNDGGVAIACGSCGQGRNRPAGYYEPWGEAAFNERSMIQLGDDELTCQQYHGQFTGTRVFIAGQGTEHEKVFLKQNKLDAVRYAREHKVKLTRQVSVISLCHDRVVAMLGA